MKLDTDKETLRNLIHGDAVGIERAGMAWIPHGAFLMGCAEFYPEEAPVRRVEVGGFWIDAHPVTVAEFRRFVKATGHVTVAERAPAAADFPDADPKQLVPGSLVFRPRRGPVDLRDFRNWWSYLPGASWRTPEGPGSDTYQRARHPVTHVAYEDARAYAEWVGKALPTEAEWEYGRHLPAQRLRAVRHDRERLGVDSRPVRGRALGVAVLRRRGGPAA